MDRILEKLLDKARNLGWSVTEEDGNVYDLGKYSPAGQDFHISVDTEDDPDLFIYNLEDIYNNFDVSEETYLWLDNSGHGTNGAPYDMKDVYNDMEACEMEIGMLYNQLNDYLAELYNEEYLMEL